MNKYKYELIIAFVGFVLSVVSLFVKNDLVFIIISLTIIVDLAVSGIKYEIKENMSAIDDNYKYINSIRNSRWKEKAEGFRNDLKDTLKEMAEGNRKIGVDCITREELALIESAKKSIKSLNYIDDLVRLKMRALENASTNPLYALLKKYCSEEYQLIDKKRVYIIGHLNFGDESIKELLAKMNKLGSAQHTEKGMGFQTRFVHLSKLDEINMPKVGNLLLIDNKEATSVIDKTRYPENYLDNNGLIVRDLICTGTINKKQIDKYRDVFQKIWEQSNDFDTFFNDLE